MAGNHNTKIYKPQGGDQLIVGPGGTLDIEAGGALDIAGVTMNASAAALNQTALQLKILSVVAANGGGSADTVDVTIEVRTIDGDVPTDLVLLHVWLSDLADGTAGSAHTHSTPPAFTVGEIASIMITADAWWVLTDATGTAVLRLLDTANEDVTINAEIPGWQSRIADTTVAADWDP